MAVRIINADVIAGLRQLPDESVHCVVTSPPYWGLRDYGTGEWVGGDTACEHKVREKPSVGTSTLGGGKSNVGHQQEGFKAECPRCGATRVDHQIGLEATPEAFVARMVKVFREVRRVLRSDGTCWLNLGDSYSSGNRATYRSGASDNKGQRVQDDMPRPEMPPGLKPKDLVGIPWMVAFALRADGWYLRSDVVWAKPNPMPESVTDRPTKAHEYVFLLTKSERYFYDSEAIKEPALYTGLANMDASGFKDPRSFNGKHQNGYRSSGGKNETIAAALPERRRGHSRKHEGFNARWDAMERAEQCSGMRNKRSVWTVATAPYADAHFATFPPDLIEPMILAGTSAKGCCAKCGAPWERETEREFVPQSDVSLEKGVRGINGQKPMDASNSWQGFPRGTTRHETIGWEPTCKCPAANPYTDAYDVVPATVLDPFSGAGTTCLVADRLQRNGIGIELNPEYVAMSEKRINGDRGGLLDLMEGAA